MKFKIYTPTDFDVSNGPIDEEYYNRHCEKYKRFSLMYDHNRNDGLASLNSELNLLCFKERMNEGFTKEAYQQQARALYLIISEIMGG